MLLLCFYVPLKDKEIVKEAVFKAGAGKMKNYDSCAFEISGIGQFRSLKGSHPAIGEHGKLEKVAEVKIEMVCEKADISKIINALHDSHPYETPAYHVIDLLIFNAKSVYLLFSVRYEFF